MINSLTKERVEVCTNTIEGHWTYSKQHFKEIRGTSPENFRFSFYNVYPYTIYKYIIIVNDVLYTSFIPSTLFIIKSLYILVAILLK